MVRHGALVVGGRLIWLLAKGGGPFLAGCARLAVVWGARPVTWRRWSRLSQAPLIPSRHPSDGPVSRVSQLSQEHSVRSAWTYVTGQKLSVGRLGKVCP